VAAHLDVLPEGVHAFARDVLFTDVPTAAPDAPLTDILKKLVTSPLRRVVIVDADRTIRGIIHDWDLLQCFVRQNSPTLVAKILGVLTQREAVPATLEGTAEEVMSREVLSVSPDTPLSEVIRTLVDNGVKRLVVADEKGRLLGMVDRDVILKALAGQNSPEV